MRYEIYSAGCAPLFINAMGISPDAGNNRFGPAKRNLRIVHFVISGKGVYNGNTVSRGQGFLIYPDILEEYLPDSDDPWEFLWVTSPDSAMDLIFDRFNADPDTLIFDYGSIQAVKSLGNAIKERSGTIIDALETAEMFLHLVNSLFRGGTETAHAPKSEMYLDFCREYIDAHLHDATEVGEIAAILNISQPYLYKIFKSRLGLSPKEYILRRKLEYAKKMLTETDLSVTRIAASVGYNILAFSKMFKAKEKISPSQYRDNTQLTSSPDAT